MCRRALFGNEWALLLDTGATATPARFPLRATVDESVGAWLREHPRPGYQRVVAPTYGHGEHVGADTRITGRPATTWWPGKRLRSKGSSASPPGGSGPPVIGSPVPAPTRARLPVRSLTGTGGGHPDKPRRSRSPVARVPRRTGGAGPVAQLHLLPADR